MGKDVTIEVPTAHLEMKAHNVEPKGQKSTMHFVPVPDEALAEVLEVLKKYEPQILKFNELLSQAIKEQKS